MTPAAEREQGVELDLRVRSERSAVLAVRGRLDAVTAAAFRGRVQGLVREGFVDLVCDLGGVDFLDSSGLSALVFALKTTREHGGSLKLAGSNALVARMLRVTTLDRVIATYPDVEAALA